MSEQELSQGTFKCDICGRDTPHHHDPELVEMERLIRPAFEKTTVPGNMFGRIKSPNFPYSDGRTEGLWQHFIGGWFACKKLYLPTAPSDPYAKLEKLVERKREQGAHSDPSIRALYDRWADELESTIAELRAGEGTSER
jgi:hypothetical protein